MIRVTCLIKNAGDATSFYRGFGPLSELKRFLWPELTLEFSTALNWIDVKNSDIVFMQRPYTQEDAINAEFAKKSGVPLWVDYDDDLMSVTQDNPAYRIYGSPVTKGYIHAILNMADRISVSTNQLKNRFGNFCNIEKIVEVPNALDFQLLDRMKSKITPDEKSKICMWRGSNSHDRDMHVFTDAICEGAKRNPDWSFLFCGDPYWMTMEALGGVTKKILRAPFSEPMIYFENIIKLAPQVSIIPLYDNQFNRSKSAIALMEATYAGAVCLVPEWHEEFSSFWGAKKYKNQEDFAAVLDDLLNIDSAGLKQINANNLNELRKTRSLEKINLIRKSLIESLI